MSKETAPTTGVKRDSTSLDDQEHFWEIIKDFKDVFFLSRRSDGTEHGRPMHISCARPDEGIYFFTHLKSPKVEEVKEDDHITITGQMSSKWIYAVGKASVITDKAKITELWTEGVRPWFPDGTSDSDVSLLCIKPERGEYWDQSTLSNKINFAWQFGKAYVTGTKMPKTLDKDGEQHSKVELTTPSAAK